MAEAGRGQESQHWFKLHFSVSEDHSRHGEKMHPRDESALAAPSRGLGASPGWRPSSSVLGRSLPRPAVGHGRDPQSEGPPPSPRELRLPGAFTEEGRRNHNGKWVLRKFFSKDKNPSQGCRARARRSPMRWASPPGPAHEPLEGGLTTGHLGPA